MKRTTTNLTLEQHIAEVKEAWRSILSIPRPPDSYFELLLKDYTVAQLRPALAYVGREYPDIGCGEASSAIEANLSDWDRERRIELEKQVAKFQAKYRRLSKALGLKVTRTKKRPAAKKRAKKADLHAAYKSGQQNFARAVEMVTAQITPKGGQQQ